MRALSGGYCAVGAVQCVLRGAHDAPSGSGPRAWVARLAQQQLGEVREHDLSRRVRRLHEVRIQGFFEFGEFGARGRLHEWRTESGLRARALRADGRQGAALHSVLGVATRFCVAPYREKATKGQHTPAGARRRKNLRARRLLARSERSRCSAPYGRGAGGGCDECVGMSIRRRTRT